MADNSYTQNLQPNVAQLADLLKQLKKDIFLNLNCHHLGTIESFNSANQTAEVTVNYTKTYFEFDSESQGYVPVQVNYPLLADCPVICLGGGTGALTFPIAKGDECLLLYNDRDIDNWFNGSATGPVRTPRLHAFADAIALVGVRSLNHSLTDYASNAVVLKKGTTFLKLEDDKATIKAANGTTVVVDSAGKLSITNPVSTLATSDLLKALINILTTANAGGFPLVISAPDLAVLQSFKP